MKKIIFLLGILLPIFSFSQTIQSGDLVTEINSIIASLPGEGTNDYVTPTAMEITDWESMLDDLFLPNYASANTKANALGYDLIEFTDTPTGIVHYILTTTSGGSNHWGTYVLNPSACRSELVIMSPHPKKDLNTGKQGIYCYKTTDAFFYMLSGTNRCNQSAASTCSGTTGVCSGGTSEAYKITDMAHVVDGIWQNVTTYLHDNFSSTYFVQLHGFTKRSTDPYLIMSNGTRVTPTVDKIASLRDELLVVDNSLTFKIAHIDLTWNRLIGFTNTNGRFINSSSNACSNNATTTNGRFLHIEQEKSKLRDDSTGWHKMATALGETFNSNMCASVNPLPVELSEFSAEVNDDRIFVFWKTLSEINNAFFVLEKSKDGIYFQEINRQAGQGNSTTFTNYYFWDEPWEGLNYYRLLQEDFDGTFNYSSIVSLFYGKNDLSKTHVFFDGEKIKLEGFPKEKSEFILFNQLGQVILSVENNADANALTEIEIPKLSPNIYFYQIKSRGKIESGKLFLK